MDAVSRSEEALGVEISVEGMYYDGKKLAIGWRTNNTQPSQPALVFYTGVTIGGVSIQADYDYPISQWWPRVFGLSVAGDPINDLTDTFYTKNLQGYDLHGVMEVTANFIVKRPRQPIVVIDAEINVPCGDEDTETDRRAMLQAMRDCGVTIAQPGDMDVKTWRERGYLAVDQSGDLINDEGTTEGMPAFNGEDMPDADAAEVELSFSVDFDSLSGL